MITEYIPEYKVEWEQDTTTRFRGVWNTYIFWIEIHTFHTTLEVPKELSGTGKAVTKIRFNPETARKLAERYVEKSASVINLKVAK